MEKGWVKTPRYLLESGLFQKHHALVLFIYFTLRAAYKPREEAVPGGTITLEPGQLVFGRKTVAERLNMTERELRNALTYLKNSHTVTCQPTRHYTIISIVNWDSYSGDENYLSSNKVTPESHPSHTRVTPETTIKEYKNIRNNLNIESKDSISFSGEPKTGDDQGENSFEQPELVPQPKDKKGNPCPYTELVNIYHDILSDLPSIKILSETRKRKLKRIWSIAQKRVAELGREPTPENQLTFFCNVCKRAAASDFLMGRKQGCSFQMTFDWLANETNFVKILEGNYDNRDRA